MMTEEEKKAIEKVKKILYMFPESEELKLILNLIENQRKEIQELEKMKENIDEVDVSRIKFAELILESLLEE